MHTFDTLIESLIGSITELLFILLVFLVRISHVHDQHRVGWQVGCYLPMLLQEHADL